jgi:hypothetical protein
VLELSDWIWKFSTKFLQGHAICSSIVKPFLLYVHRGHAMPRAGNLMEEKCSMFNEINAVQFCLHDVAYRHIARQRP